MVQHCPRILSQGVCTVNDCPLNHDVPHLCQPCRVVCSSAHNLHAHLKGKRHRSQLRTHAALAAGYKSFCNVCNVPLSSAGSWPEHVAGVRHQSTLQESHQSGENPRGSDDDDDSESFEARVPPGCVQCNVCDTFVQQRSWSAHITGIKHRKKERFATVQAAFDEAGRDKHGVTISHGGEDGVDFGLLEVTGLSPVSTKDVGLTVLLTTSGAVYLTEARLSSSMSARVRDSNFKVVSTTFPKRLVVGHSVPLVIRFNPNSQTGRFFDRLELVFLDQGLQTRFSITRNLNAVVGAQADWEILKPTAPYKPERKTKRVSEKEVIPGPKPPAMAAIQWTVKLEDANVPVRLEDLAGGMDTKSVVRDVRRMWLPTLLQSESYARHFKTLLYLEEITMKTDIQRYDEENVLMTPVPPFYSLPVPGLAEKRPSVIVGDRILVQNAGSKKSGRWFEGYVYKVHLNDVELKFHQTFHSYRGQRYNVRFQIQRIPLRRMHQAVGTAFDPARVLFPTEAHLKGRSAPGEASLQRVRPVNRLISSNPPQLLAVTAIKDMPKGSVPFIIFGPPGTGKTVTTCEAMRQILLADPNARILACAPSNSAADLIAERLSDTLPPKELFRLNAPSRSKEGLPTILLRYTQSNNQGTFCVPELSVLREFRVIVSTCVSASVPYGTGMPRGHFTHVFIDEAGQACEPEAMIPIKTMADNDTRVILSGDPKQLGPIIRSSVAIELGLGVSYLDRLMARDIYDPETGHGISVVKLTKNWRSHGAILKYPNEQFYKAELEPRGNPVVTNSLLRSDVLIKPGFPLVFHSITGKDLREGNSPSFFNPDEASQVKRYVEALKADKKLMLKDDNIGIIAPYHAQVLKIRGLIKKIASGIKVGSVEEFQGQERRVIVISTVRSNLDFVDHDVRHTLGFVANPRRFNVAVTRAQALLVVVGDASVLSLDPLWRGFLNYIHQQGGWTGKRPDWDTSEPVRVEGEYDAEVRATAQSDMDRLIERTRTLILESSECLAGDEDNDQANVDRPWREAD